jgi:hypothetical protein
MNLDSLSALSLRKETSETWLSVHMNFPSLEYLELEDGGMKGSVMVG